MGNIGTTMKEYFFKPKSYRIVIGGLDAAGKTTVLYKLKLGEVVTTIPTIGFNVETVSYTGSMKGSSVDFVMWDVGGRDKSRTLFLRHYAPNSSAILMCVDSNDRERIDEVREYIDNILKIEGLEGVPLLVFANKQDINGAMTPEEVEDALNLHNIKDRPYHVEGCSATKGEGLWEGLGWVARELEKQEMKSSLSAPMKETIEDGKTVMKTGTSWLYSVFCWRKSHIDNHEQAATLVAE